MLFSGESKRKHLARNRFTRTDFVKTYILHSSNSLNIHTDLVKEKF